MIYNFFSNKITNAYVHQISALGLSPYCLVCFVLLANIDRITDGRGVAHALAGNLGFQRSISVTRT
jgi:hypothetical protein